MAIGDSEPSYFLRNRGRVTGPLSLTDVRLQVRRGVVGRAHEISRDARTWISAGRVAELFGTTDVALPVADAPAEAESDAVTSPAVFYRHGDRSFGPMPSTLLESLAINGKLPADAMVWADGDTQSRPASTHPLLAHLGLFAGGAAVAENATRIPSGSHFSGCGLMLLVAVLLGLAGGVYVAIDLSSTSTETPKSPQTRPSTTLPASMPATMRSYS